MRGRRSQRAAALTLAVSLALLSYAAADETTSADTTTRPPFGKKRLSEDEEKEVPRNLQVDIVTANAQNEDKLLWFLGPERTLKFRPDTCGVGGDELLQYTICMDGFTPNRLRAETFGVNPSIQLVLQQLTATATGTACVWPKLKPLASAAIPLDPSKRGKMKYSDACSTELDCGFPDSICDEILKTCRCHSDTPVSNHVDKCGKPAGINESCIFNEQCEDVVLKTECRNERCVCMYEMVAEVSMDGAIMCVPAKQIEESTRTLDPAMIGVLVGMALMFIIICVVLQLFSRARWRENRTIFNTPNPRLMNVSLLRDSKLLHSQDRRESHVSMRPPSRHASQQELRPHSPGADSVVAVD